MNKGVLDLPSKGGSQDSIGFHNCRFLQASTMTSLQVKTNNPASLDGGGERSAKRAHNVHEAERSKFRYTATVGTAGLIQGLQ